MRLLSLLFCFAVLQLNGQASFTKITDANNPLAQQAPLSAYIGVSWVDYNGDGLDDCFINSNNLYRNDGGGAFTKITFSALNPGDGNGNSWGDYDGDGDLDVMIAATPARLYRNDGDDTFTLTPLTSEVIDTFNFWSTAWGDYNGDGWIDLGLFHPAGFLPFSNPISRPSLLFVNNQDGSFTRIDSPLDDELAAHTVGTWTDYDLDGDLDLFIGSGEVAFLSRDHIFINQLAESGTAQLLRLEEGPLATDLRDGQNWNFIDYDLDGDLDAYITNYFNSKTNDLYRNENGAYVKQTTASAGPIVGQMGLGLNNVWGDFDNDGYQDCFVVFDGGQRDRYYHNNGDGTFTEVNQVFSIPASSRGAAAADYDDDGYLDLMIAGTTASAVGLYHNDGGDNHWFQLRLHGDAPNTAAIGAKVWVKAEAGGQLRWMYRELNSQNTFNGHNSYRLHFGLGQSSHIDSIRVVWPDGTVQEAANIAIDQSCIWNQDGTSDCGPALSVKSQSGTPQLHFSLSPNPATVTAFINFRQAGAAEVYWQVYGQLGQPLEKLRGSYSGLKEGQIALPIKGLPAGLYRVVVWSKYGTQRENLVIGR
ncbi:MAG: CRTAC1 family protein [Lewinellaceae bacterium]|nr:CRTAC1 family protein [Lewinellaceae bacterium]